MAALPTAVWRVRPGGNNNNGGGFDAGISSPGTDYSKQDAPQVTQSNPAVTSTATVTLTDTGASFTAALIGNAIKVSGTGITTTYTFITGVPSGTTLTLQTSPGTTGTTVSYNIGGAWADFWTNTKSTAGILVPGNTVYILGSGTPNPASYTYDYSWTFVSSSNHVTPGDNTTGRVTYTNDPATPGYIAPPSTTGGMPVIQVSGQLIGGGAIAHATFSGLWFVSSSSSGHYIFDQSGVSVGFIGCVFDAFGHDNGFSDAGGNIAVYMGNEIFSSTGSGGMSNGQLNIGGNGLLFMGNNVHDCTGIGIKLSGVGGMILNNIVSKCTSNGIVIENVYFSIVGNTIDGNGGHGITVNDTGGIATTKIFNNIVSNHTAGGKYGITVLAGTAAVNFATYFDYNVFYNNTANYNAINAGPHDTALGSDPYTAQTTEDYKLV